MHDYEGKQPAHDTWFYTRATHEYIMRDLQNTGVASDARVAHKESRAYTKKRIFKVFLGIFRLWCLLESFS